MVIRPISLISKAAKGLIFSLVLFHIYIKLNFSIYRETPYSKPCLSKILFTIAKPNPVPDFSLLREDSST